MEAGNLLAVTLSGDLSAAPCGGDVRLLPERPEVRRVGGAEVLDPFALQGLADRFEERLAVLFHQRLEESQAKDLALAFVDAWGEILVDVVAEQMATQERSAAVRLHEQLDGGLFLGLAA